MHEGGHIMKRIQPTFAALILVLAAQQLVAQPQTRIWLPTTALISNGSVERSAVLPVEYLQEDFRQLRESITLLHPNPYAFTRPAEFRKMFEETERQLTVPMTLEEFYRLVAPLAACIGCGHSTVWMPPSYWQDDRVRLFPLRVKVVCEKFCAVGSYTGSDLLPPGSEIVAIDGKKTCDIVKAILPIISSDGGRDPYKLFFLSDRFPMLYGPLFGYRDVYSITYRMPGEADLRTIDVPAATWSEFRSVAQAPAVRACVVDETHRNAVLTLGSFNSYSGDDLRAYKDFIDQVFEEIDAAGVEDLILDLRGNNGGNPYCASFLLSHLTDEPVPYFAKPYARYGDLALPVEPANDRFSGNLIVLTDASCFSTSGHLLALLRYYGIGTFVGEETGGTFACNDAKRTVQLTNSRLHLQLARDRFSVAVEGLQSDEGLFPDYLVETTPVDLFEGRDPVLQRAYDILAKQN
jgi:hypothetical protein